MVEAVAKVDPPDVFEGVAQVALHELGNLLAEWPVVEKQAAYIGRAIVLDGEKTFPVGINFGRRHIDQSADFAGRPQGIFFAGYPSPDRRPIAGAPIGHERMLAQFHGGHSLSASTVPIKTIDAG